MGPAEAPTAAPIAQNLADIRRRIAAAAERAGRRPQSVTLVAVSKAHPLDAIEAAYGAGQRDFGENRLDELWTKIATAKQRGLDGIRWHFVGTIQSRKSKQAIGPIELLHAVDRIKIANRISRDAEEAGCVMRVLLEVNVSGEESKHGFTEQALAEQLPELLLLPGMRIDGLMTMAPFVQDEARLRSVFRRLRRVRDELNMARPEAALKELSMGMTNDFEVAIEEGATMVRIGSAIFGQRIR